MARRKESNSQVLRILTGLAYVALLAFFVMEFVFLNNPSFILYSFLFFIALGIALGVYEEFVGQTLVVSLAFIAVSSVMYFGNYALLGFVWLNLAIVGYYLLISVVIGIFIGAFAGSNGFEKRIARVGKGFARLLNGNLTRYVPVVIAAALIMAPIWPSSLVVPQSQYVNRTAYVSYYGNATNSTSYTLEAAPPPYQYIVKLCANGTNATANISIRSRSGAYAFLFSNASALGDAMNRTVGYPYARYAPIYERYANSSVYSDGSEATSNIGIPNYGCSYMALVYGNASIISVHVAYNISYYGLAHAYRTVRVIGNGAPLVVNGTSSVFGSIGLLSKLYRSETVRATLNSAASSRN